MADGSYNAPKKDGYGGFLMHGGVKEVLQGAGEDAEMRPCVCGGRGVRQHLPAVEGAGAWMGELTIYYDYMGIYMGGGRTWKAKQKGHAVMTDRIMLHFVKRSRGTRVLPGNQGGGNVWQEGRHSIAWNYAGF